MPLHAGSPSNLRLHARVYRAVMSGALCALLIMLAGCSRQYYREQADEQTFSIIGEKTAEGTWTPPSGFSIEPGPESRLFDPSPVETPELPDPMPRLHQYEIPWEFGRRSSELSESEEAARKKQTEIVLQRAAESSGWRATGQRRQVIHADAASSRSAGDSQRLDNGYTAQNMPQRILLTRYLAQDEMGVDPDDVLEVKPVTIDPSAWESIPVECRMRMFEFTSTLAEYESSFVHGPPIEELDRSPRLNFDDIVELALLNSREYQSEKEQLYRVALRLSLERFDYDLKFSPFNNRTGLAFDSSRTSNSSSSRLGIPTRAGMEAMLNTGSSLVARFANDVVLTFGGPDGFAADVGSELLFELTHSVLQNDVRFERLTQAERNVIYAARDFARFRRTFYQQLATQYYNLIRTYRQVEIDSQNYFSLVRVYNQRAIELDEGQIPRVQIDQVEQNALAGRSSLISTCNNLEAAFDQLKLTIGLPTETLINIDLRELDELTLQDEALVALELVQRVRSRIVAEQQREEPDTANLLNHAAELAGRMQEALALLRQLHPKETDDEFNDARLKAVQSQLHVAGVRVTADRIWQQLETDRQEPDLPAWRIPERSQELARAVLAQIQAELEFCRQLNEAEPAITKIQSSQEQLTKQLDATRNLADEVLSDSQLQRLDELNVQAQALIDTAQTAAQQSSTVTDALAETRGLDLQQTPNELVADPLASSQRLLRNRTVALNSIRIDMDEASLAALLLRLDLMTSRGQLADDWRGIKLAADDLRSILNLSARQRLRTENNSNRPTEFDFDESRTEVAVTLDTPLNRRAQRNTFREQLLNYQRSRRRLMGVEDTIKRDIRSDIRRLRLAEEQHVLAIASAALAQQRASSTELQLRLGVGGVAARDFLEAQTAYAASLSAVASRHIEHILGRIRLYVDLEQLQLNNNGHWSGLRDPDAQPSTAPAAGSGIDYGDLPQDLNYSSEVQQGFR